MDLDTIRLKIEKGELKEAKKMLEFEKKLVNYTYNEVVTYYQLLFRINDLLGNYSIAVDISNDLIHLADIRKDEQLRLEAMITKSSILWKWYKLEELLEVILEAEEILFNRKNLEDEVNLILFSKLKHLKGAYYRFLGELDVSLEYFYESFAQAEMLNDTRLLSLCYNANGLIHLDMGLYEDALINLNQAKIMREDNEQEELALATTLFNLGRLSEFTGQMTDALNYYTKGLEIGIKKSCVRTQALITKALGLLHNKINEVDNAMTYLNESFFLFQMLDNDYYTSQIIFDIIRVYTLNNKVDAIHPFLEHIDHIHKNSSSVMIDLYHKLCWASYQKDGDRLIDRAKAQKTFKEIATQEILDYSLFVYAVLNLTYMLFSEFKFSTNKDVIDELYNIMKLLRIEHKNSFSNTLLVESLIIESKLARLEMNINYAYEVLSNAFDIAVKNSYKEMQIKISNEYDSLLEHYMEDVSFASNEDLIERIQEIELENYIADLLQSRVKSFDIVDINPIVFLIVDSDDNHLITKILDEAFPIDKEYIASLLSTIDSFIGNFLGRKEFKLERLKFGSAYILFREINNHRIIYCFDSTASFTGVERFNNLVDEISVDLEGDIDTEKLLYKINQHSFS